MRTAAILDARAIRTDNSVKVNSDVFLTGNLTELIFAIESTLDQPVSVQYYGSFKTDGPWHPMGGAVAVVAWVAGDPKMDEQTLSGMYPKLKAQVIPVGAAPTKGDISILVAGER